MTKANPKKENLTAITWAHAVNSQQKLIEALNSNNDMIEADIVLGRLNNIGDELPVMAHPPAVSSDISLESFLRQINAYNEEFINRTKGVKLDFKSIDAFDESLLILNELVPFMNAPIWLNADIISGPVNQTDVIPIEPSRFLAGCIPFDKAVLSIGWTTCWSANHCEGGYTVKHIREMLQAIKESNITNTKHTITFPVRAGIAANSQETLHELLRAVDNTNKCSITIWSSPGDHVDTLKLRQLIHSFGVNRVYLDVPEELLNGLILNEVIKGRTARITPLFNFGVISLCLVAASLWLQRIQL